MAIAPEPSRPAPGSPALDNPGRAANSQMLVKGERLAGSAGVSIAPQGRISSRARQSETVGAREEAGGQLGDYPARSPQINPFGVERMASSRLGTCALGGTARFSPRTSASLNVIAVYPVSPHSIAVSAWIGWVWVVVRGDLVHMAGERPGRWQDPARPEAPCAAGECGLGFSPDVDSVTWAITRRGGWCSAASS